MNARAILVVPGALIATAAMGQIIDDFSTGPYSITANAGSPSVEAVRVGTMMGGERDALIAYISGPLGTNATVDSGMVQFFASDSQTMGALTLQYDGMDGEVENGVLNPGSNLGANMSGANAFLFDFRFVNAGIASSMQVMTTVVTATGTFSDTVAVPEGTNVMVAQPFSSFGAADFSDVRRVEFTFSGPAATDFTLRSIGLQTIPGPSAALPFLIGLLGRRRR